MKLGLVLEGGASRTVFSCGVMDVLLENNIIADYVIGTSAGIAYGISYASKQMGRNRTVSVKYMNDKRYMGIRHLLNPKNRSFYNLDFVFDEIPNRRVLFDYDEYRRFEGDVLATVTNIKTGSVEYMPVPADDRAFRILRASCALPIMFKPIKIGENKYLDGGICDPIPFKKALEDGCDKIIVILTREEGYKKEKDGSEKLVNLVYHKHTEFMDALMNRPNVYNASIDELSGLCKENKALVIRPEKIQGISRTESRPKVLDSLYLQGVSVCNKKLDEILAFAEK